MEDRHEHYCEKCGYEVEANGQVVNDETSIAGTSFNDYLKSFVLRLTGIVL